MARNNHNELPMTQLVRHALSVFACVALLAAPRAFALDTGDIVVTSVKGEVHVTMKGAERAVRAGSVLELPATIMTSAAAAVVRRCILVVPLPVIVICARLFRCVDVRPRILRATRAG